MPKQPKQRGGVEIEFGGETRTLRMSFNAIALLEERLGMTIPQILGGQYGIRVVREALYVGLSQDDRTLNLNKVGRIMDSEPQKITYWMNKVYEALALAMGISDVAEDSDEGEAPAPDEPADAE
ncbi:MAG TPA: hypothetical protein PKZ08_14740 [Vicinamibacterales bacterium]|nr:hypothetical protein [Vicinamibacterales bacterium]